jgi:hypothetical protein
LILWIKKGKRKKNKKFFFNEAFQFNIQRLQMNKKLEKRNKREIKFAGIKIL